MLDTLNAFMTSLKDSPVLNAEWPYGHSIPWIVLLLHRFQNGKESRAACGDKKNCLGYEMKSVRKNTTHLQ